MSKTALHKRVLNAIHEDNSIVVDVAVVEQATGFEESYMNSLGLTRYDLKQLWKHGLALRGKDSNGITRWILLGRTDAEVSNGGTSEQK